MAIEERHEPVYSVNALENGVIEVQEATIITGTKVPVPPQYSRYTLAPGADLEGKHPRIVAIAEAVWTEEVVEAYQRQMEEQARLLNQEGPAAGDDEKE